MSAQSQSTEKLFDQSGGPALLMGGGLLLMIVLAALLAPWLSPYDPEATDLSKELLVPSFTHLLGTDTDGGDILSQLIYGARISLGVSLAVTLISTVVGLLLGTFAGYFGGRIDALLMRFTDFIFAFPGLLLAIALAAALGPSVGNMIVALSITGWAGYARLVRGEVYVLREKEYVQAANALGASDRRIFFYHLWPNLIPVLLVQMTFGMAGVMLSESSLSFLGIGAPPGTPSWGLLLAQGKDVLLEAPHVAFFPGCALMVVILSFYFLGDGLQDLLDPKERNKSR